MKISFLPSKKFLVLMVVISLVGLLDYAIMYNTPPKNKVFTGYVDAGFQLALMKAIVWNFESPWDSSGISIFENPHLGGPYTLTLLGSLPTIININMLLYMLALRFILSIIYLVIIYNFINFFLKDKNNVKIAFLLFLLSSGIGWIIYGGVYTTYGSNSAGLIGYLFSYEFEEGDSGAMAISHITRVYWIVPEITGLLSLLFFTKKKNIVGGLLIGLTWLFHPTFGLPFTLMIIVYFLVDEYGRNGGFIKIIKRTLPVVIFSLVFFMPWLLSYISYPTHFQQYKAWFNSTPLLTILISSFLLISLSLYGLHKTITKSIIKNKYYILTFLTLSLLSSIIHFYEVSYLYEQPDGGGSVTTWLSNIGVFNLASTLYSNLILIDLPLLMLFFAGFVSILKMNLDKTYKLVILWIIAILMITIVPVKLINNFWWPGRMKWFLLLPFSLAAVWGVNCLTYKLKNVKLTRNISNMKIVLVIIIISLPSFLGFNFYIIKNAHNNDITYISEDDFGSFGFLANQPDGRVISSYQIGHIIPYYTNKKTLLFNNVHDERYKDYESFYSLNTSSNERSSILDKYNITYVFFGYNEKLISQGFNPSTLSFLEIIYNKNTSIYKKK